MANSAALGGSLRAARFYSSAAPGKVLAIGQMWRLAFSCAEHVPALVMQEDCAPPACSPYFVACDMGAWLPFCHTFVELHHASVWHSWGCAWEALFLLTF
jgi:hypothetical protein